MDLKVTYQKLLEKVALNWIKKRQEIQQLLDIDQKVRQT